MTSKGQPIVRDDGREPHESMHSARLGDNKNEDDIKAHIQPLGFELSEIWSDLQPCETVIFGLVWFVGFYGISTFVGYLTPNPFLCK